MPKGYWIAHGIVHDVDAYDKYRAANGPVFAKFGARFLVRGGDQKIAEGNAKPRTVILEFPSYEVAKACYESDDYQAAKALRAMTSVSESDLVIVEVYDT